MSEHIICAVCVTEARSSAAVTLTYRSLCLVLVARLWVLPQQGVKTPQSFGKFGSTHTAADERKRNRNGMVYALIFAVAMASIWCFPLFGSKLDRATCGKTLFIWPGLFSRTFNTPALSLSVTMNKPVNRIFQSSCGVLLAEREKDRFCQKREKKRQPAPPLWRQEVPPSTVEKRDPSGSTSQCLSAARVIYM